MSRLRCVKSQTSTEYLVVIATVIVIAVIVISVLGGIPSIGGGASSRRTQASLATKSIGITNFVLTDYDTTIILRNNLRNSVRIDSIIINGESCFNFEATTLRTGASMTVVCENIYEIESDFASYPISITYTDTSTNAQFTQQGEDIYISGDVGDKWQNVLDSVGFNETLGGCFNPIDQIPDICTCDDLNNTRSYFGSSAWLPNFDFVANIDFERCDSSYTTGDGWQPIEIINSWRSIRGQGHLIKNLYINRPTSDYIGLYFRNGSIGSDATSGAGLYDLSILDVEIIGNDYVGSFYGRTPSFFPVENVFVSGNISGNSRVGSLFGSFQSYSSITSSNSIAEVFCTGIWCGGLVGVNYADFTGINKWINHTNDNVTSCVGFAVTLLNPTNCTAIN